MEAELRGEVLAPAGIEARVAERSLHGRAVGLQRSRDGGAVAGVRGRGRFGQAGVEARQLRRGAGIGVGGQRLLFDPESGGVEGPARTLAATRGADRQGADEQESRRDGGRHPEAANDEAMTGH